MSPASSEQAWDPRSGADLRAADVSRVDTVLEQVAMVSPAAVRLPAMTAAELCVLGAMSSTLIDAEAWSWWTSAPTSRRPALCATAWRFLVHRGLVTAGGLDSGTGVRGGQARVLPGAALIVAARSRPAFIVLCRGGAAGEPRPTRMFGIADARHGLRAVLIEEAKGGPASWAGPAYEYQLGSLAAAGRALARWALGGGGTAPDLGSASVAERNARMVDVHLPGTRDIRPARRITVQVDSGTFRALTEPSWLYVTKQLPCDEAVLTRLLTDTLTGVCP